MKTETRNNRSSHVRWFYPKRSRMTKVVLLAVVAIGLANSVVAQDELPPQTTPRAVVDSVSTNGSRLVPHNAPQADETPQRAVSPNFILDTSFTICRGGKVVPAPERIANDGVSISKSLIVSPGFCTGLILFAPDRGRSCVALMEVASPHSDDWALVASVEPKAQSRQLPTTRSSAIAIQRPAMLMTQPQAAPTNLRIVTLVAVTGVNVEADDTVDVLRLTGDPNDKNASYKTIYESARVFEIPETKPGVLTTVSLVVEKGKVDGLLTAAITGVCLLCPHHSITTVPGTGSAIPNDPMYHDPKLPPIRSTSPSVTQYGQPIQFTNDVQYFPAPTNPTKAHVSQRVRQARPQSEAQQLLEEVREMRTLIQGLRDDMQQLRQSTEQSRPSPVRVTMPSAMPSAMPAVRVAANSAWQPYNQPLPQPAQLPVSVNERSDAEKRIELALGKEVSLDITDGTLRDAIRNLHETTGVNIVIDVTGIEEEGVTSQAEVTIQISGVTMRSALKVLLSPLRLDYVIEDEVLKVTSRELAKGQHVVVAYHVSDLVRFEAGWEVMFDELAALIRQVIEPDSWQDVGGRGSIMGNPATKSFVIRQSAQAHEEIRNLLDQIRKLKASLPAEEKPATIKYETVPAKSTTLPQTTHSVPPKSVNKLSESQPTQSQPEPVTPASALKANSESAFQFRIGFQR